MSLYWQRAHQPDDRLGGHRPCWTTKRAGQQGSISGSMRTPNVDGRQPGSEGIPRAGAYRFICVRKRSPPSRFEPYRSTSRERRIRAACRALGNSLSSSICAPELFHSWRASGRTDRNRSTPRSDSSPASHSDSAPPMPSTRHALPRRPPPVLPGRTNHGSVSRAVIAEVVGLGSVLADRWRGSVRA